MHWFSLRYCSLKEHWPVGSCECSTRTARGANHCAMASTIFLRLGRACSAQGIDGRGDSLRVQFAFLRGMIEQINKIIAVRGAHPRATRCRNHRNSLQTTC